MTAVKAAHRLSVCAHGDESENDDVTTIGARQTQQPTDGKAPTSRQAPTEEIAQYFQELSAGGAQPRLRSVTGTCRFDITGDGTWQVTIADGVPQVTQNAPSTTPADCVVTCEAEDFLHILRREGHLNLFAALLQGIVTITGDIAFAGALLGSVTVQPDGPACA
jgi:hypothetical protein